MNVPAPAVTIRGLRFSYEGETDGNVLYDSFSLGLLAQKGSLFATRPTLFTYTAQPGNLTKMARDLMRVVASGKVKVPVHARYKLADAAEAHRALEGRQTTGASVLVP